MSKNVNETPEMIEAEGTEVGMDATEPTAEEILEASYGGKKTVARMKENVRLKAFVIGVGNAGNQVVAHCYREGMTVWAINSSERDMDDLLMDDTIPCFVVGHEGRGSGKNIKKGVALWKENGRTLFQSPEFMQRCQDSDIIVVTSSTGGGTGPSVSPEICRVLKRMFDKKIIIYHGITPKNSDSNMAFSNTTYCLNEIKKLEIPYLLTDLDRFANLPNDKAFQMADAHVAKCLKAITGLYLKMSSSQMIDENDLKSIIQEPGYMAAYFVENITSGTLEKKSMQAMLIDQIKKGPAVMIQKDGISMQMGSIINCPDDLDEVTRTGDYSEIFEFLGHRPKNGIYENYGVSNGTSGEFVVILSGMTYPINRLEEYTNTIKEQDEWLKKQKEIDTTADAALVQSMVNNADTKLEADTKASESEIKAALDEFF